MWVNLNDEDAKKIMEALRNANAFELALSFDRKIKAAVDEDVNAEVYREAAIKKWAYNDDCEIDEDAIVSKGADAGAFVHAWVWVRDEDAGIEEEEDE